MTIDVTDVALNVAGVSLKIWPGKTREGTFLRLHFSHRWYKLYLFKLHNVAWRDTVIIIIYNVLSLPPSKPVCGNPLPPPPRGTFSHDDECKRGKIFSVQIVQNCKGFTPLKLCLCNLNIPCWLLVSQVRPLVFVPQHRSLSVCGTWSILKVIGAAERKGSDLRDYSWTLRNTDSHTGTILSNAPTTTPWLKVPRLFIWGSCWSLSFPQQLVTC